MDICPSFLIEPNFVVGDRHGTGFPRSGQPARAATPVGTGGAGGYTVRESGGSSVVELLPSKLVVVGSIPIPRSSYDIRAIIVSVGSGPGVPEHSPGPARFTRPGSLTPSLKSTR